MGLLFTLTPSPFPSPATGEGIEEAFRSLKRIKARWISHHHSGLRFLPAELALVACTVWPYVCDTSSPNRRCRGDGKSLPRHRSLHRSMRWLFACLEAR